MSITMKPSLYVTDISGAVKEDISDYIRNGRVVMNQDAEVSMSFDCQLRTPVPLTAWSDFLVPKLEVIHSNGLVVSGTVGMYAVAPPPSKHGWANSSATVDGRDLTWLLANDAFEVTKTLSNTADALAFVRSVIISAGIPANRIYLAPRAVSPGQTELPTKLPTTRDWAIGVDKLLICNDVLTALNYYTLFMENSGRLTSIPIIDMTEKQAAVYYATGDGSQVIGEVEEEPSLTGFANVVIVTANSPLSGAVATPPSAPPPPPPSSIAIDETVKLTQRQNLRINAGTDNSIVTVLPIGTPAKIIGGPSSASGYTWWTVDATIRGIGQRQGWTIVDGLQLIPGAPDPAVTPIAPPPIRAYRVNDDPGPTSILAPPLGIGRRIVRFYEGTDIETQAQADVKADALMQSTLSHYTRLILRTLPDPQRGMHEAYDLNLTDRQGVEIAMGKWLCRGWELGFVPKNAAMTHTCHRVEPWAYREGLG